MQCLNFEEAVAKIVAQDARYQYAAYVFVQEALKHTQKMLGRSSSGKAHVGGKELLEGIRGYALETYGPMALTVLEEWGVRSCEDFGEIVFNMIAHNLASKTDSDSREDFRHGYDFIEAFRKPFLPSRAAQTAPPKSVEA
ncbi:MAG TPA: Minf_1886 family protein [Verrucomicrobiae bacterium]|jgi:uncharacterized repeat protein (TIGR04138 family)|nr:Minf_1886 family protein [Verrucomicrobiae bacterium]